MRGVVGLGFLKPIINYYKIGLGGWLGIRIRELELGCFCYDRIKGSFRVEKIF